jgi:hypothetical protein
VDTGNRPPLPCGQIWGFGLPVGELLHAPSHKSALDAFNILLRPPDKLGAVDPSRAHIRSTAALPALISSSHDGGLGTADFAGFGFFVMPVNKLVW